LRALPAIVMFAWSLWFGGIVMLFLSVNSLFRTFAGDRPTAGLGATGIFQRFEIYQLILAAVAILATVLWRMRACSRAKRWLLMLLLAAAVMGVAITALVTPRIEAMRIAGTTQTLDFARLHGVSMLLYLIETLFLLLAGTMLFISMRSEATPLPSPRTSAGIGRASAPPDEAVSRSPAAPAPPRDLR
jgi:predicted membrane channel-forming protein YqfA (hemolysin III family)